MYAFLRFEKRKSGDISGIEKHHERQKQEYKTNPDINLYKSDENYHLIKPKATFKDEIKNRIESAHCRVRKDSVLFVDTIITASPEFFYNKNGNSKRLFFECALGFLSQKIGRDNIFMAIVHMDEKTPHMHLCFTPITKDLRLSAKDIIGNKATLSNWQDDFFEYMKSYYPAFEERKKAIHTKRKHLPTQELKKQSVESMPMTETQKSLAILKSMKWLYKHGEISESELVAFMEYVEIERAFYKRFGDESPPKKKSKIFTKV